MGRFTIPTLPTLPPGVKPSYPVEIDRSNPLSEGLSHFLLFQHGEVHDLVTGRPCTKGGGTKWTPEGQYFDESGDYLTLADVELNSDFTILTHPNFEDNAGNLFQYFLSFGNFTASNSFNWYLVESLQGTGTDNIRVVGDSGSDGAISEITGYWSSKNNKPLAASVSGTTINQYISGVDVDDGSTFGSSGMADGTTNTLYIGSRSDTNADRMTGGWLKYVIVYGGRTLSADEVASLQRDPYQFLKPAVPQTQIITPATTPNDRVWIV